MNNITMKPEVKASWLEALRSGEYQQGKRALCIVTKEGDKRCCLGVLTDLAVKAGVLKAEKNTVVDTLVGDDGDTYEAELRVYPDGSGGTEQSFPPESVLRWAGLVNSDMGYPVADPPVGGYSLATWNDDLGENFAKIADLIEQYL